MSRLPRFVSSLVLAGCLGFGALGAARAAESGLSVSGAWSRPTAAASMPAVVYMTVTDTGAPTTLVSVSSPVAAHAALHQSKMVNGMMEMLPVKALPVAPGKPITFGPGGYHVMLTEMTKPLTAGETFPVTLTFANGAAVTATVTVRSMVPQGSGSGSDSGAMGGMKM